MNNMNQEIDNVIRVLQSEVQYISSKVSTENDEKVKSKMLKQLNVINGVLTRLIEIKNNAQYYRV